MCLHRLYIRLILLLSLNFPSLQLYAKTWAEKTTSSSESMSKQTQRWIEKFANCNSYGNILKHGKVSGLLCILLCARASSQSSKFCNSGILMSAMQSMAQAVMYMSPKASSQYKEETETETRAHTDSSAIDSAGRCTCFQQPPYKETNTIHTRRHHFICTDWSHSLTRPSQG